MDAGASGGCSRRTAADLYGCHEGVRAFPHEANQVCGFESGSLNAWALGVALVTALQGVAWAAWVPILELEPWIA